MLWCDQCASLAGQPLFQPWTCDLLLWYRICLFPLQIRTLTDVGICLGSVPCGSMRAQQPSLGQAHSSFCQMPELMGFRSPSNRSQTAQLLSSTLKRILISCSVGNCKKSYHGPFPSPLADGQIHLIAQTWNVFIRGICNPGASCCSAVDETFTGRSDARGTSMTSATS